jgi:ACR3 family arsenite efflux pump ArsB
MSFISPITLIAVLTMLERRIDCQIPMDVVRIAIPLVIYFDVCVELSWWEYFGADILKVPPLPLQRRETISNWPSLAIGVFGINGWLGVIGPLVEVPLIALVNVLFWFRKILSPLQFKFIVQYKTILLSR